MRPSILLQVNNNDSNFKNIREQAMKLFPGHITAFEVIRRGNVCRQIFCKFKNFQENQEKRMQL